MRWFGLILYSALAFVHAEDQPQQTEAEKESSRLASIQLKQEDVRQSLLAIIALHRKYHTCKADKGDPRPRMQRILSEIIELNQHQGARNNARLDYLRGEALEITENIGKEREHLLEILDNFRGEQTTFERLLSQLAILNGTVSKDDEALLKRAKAVISDFDTPPKPEELGIASLAIAPVAKRVVVLKEGKPIEALSLQDLGGDTVFVKGLDGKQVKIPRDNIKEIVDAKPKPNPEKPEVEKSTEQAKVPEK